MASDPEFGRLDHDANAGRIVLPEIPHCDGSPESLRRLVDVLRLQNNALRTGFRDIQRAFQQMSMSLEVVRLDVVTGVSATSSDWVISSTPVWVLKKGEASDSTITGTDCT